jgi:methionine-rich copper-binding protein CopC
MALSMPRSSAFRHWSIPLLLGSLIAALVFATWASRPVLAHAEPDRLAPEAGSLVASAPAIVEIWFDEEVTPGETTVAVFDANGNQVDLGDSQVDLNDPERRHVTVSLRPGLPPGTYTVRWHSLSAADQDPADGRFAFTIAGAASPAADTPPRASPTVAASPVQVASPAPATPPPTATPTPAIPEPIEDEDDDSGALAGGLIAAALVVVLGSGGWLRWRRRRPPAT